MAPAPIFLRHTAFLQIAKPGDPKLPLFLFFPLIHNQCSLHPHDYRAWSGAFSQITIFISMCVLFDAYIA
jgi:hypothetical protein